MQQFLLKVTQINNVVNNFIWGKVGIILLIATGILMTVLTGVFQIHHVREWWGATIGSVFKKGAKVKDKSESGAVSQFQALCTALAATIGTGNIVGVASAIAIGGPGAVFWMWMAAFFGMMTNFSENVLGIYYRRKNAEGEWSGGAMYYLKDGVGKIVGYERLGKILAVLFSCFAILASFGIGNFAQINKIVSNVQSAFFSKATLERIGGPYEGVTWVAVILGVLLVILGAVIILGGLQRIANVAEKIVPFMACLYVIGALVVFGVHIDKIGAVFVSIFKFAFGAKAIAGGAVGQIIIAGCKRGVFSNEAGLGSSVMVHSNSNVVEPVQQGMWGIFEVFADTIVVCTMTAVVVLSSGFVNLQTGLMEKGVDDSTLVAKAFGQIFHKPGEVFVALALLLFAFTTVLGWSHYGSKSIEYLLGLKAAKIYKVIFVVAILGGALMTSSLAWDISDTFNGLMMLPNLVGVVALSPVVVGITRNYIARKHKGEKIEPMISAIPQVQKEQAAKLDTPSAS